MPADLSDLKANAAAMAARMKLMSHPERLLMLCRMDEGEVSVTELVSTFILISGKWKVEDRMPGFTSSVIRACTSILPRALSTQTISPSSMPCFAASSGWIIRVSVSRISALPVRRVCAPTLYWLRMRPVVSSSG